MEGHTQVNLSGLSELAREQGSRILIAHMRDINESVGTRQLDRRRCIRLDTAMQVSMTPVLSVPKKITTQCWVHVGETLNLLLVINNKKILS